MEAAQQPDLPDHESRHMLRDLHRQRIHSIPSKVPRDAVWPLQVIRQRTYW